MNDPRDITRALGGRWHGTYGTACCPAHEDRTPSLSVFPGDHVPVALKCHAGCDGRAIRAALRDLGIDVPGGASPIASHAARVVETARRQKEGAGRARIAAELWESALPIHGTPGEAYLRTRGITAGIPQTLRYAPRCWHQSARRLPAVIARVEGANGTAIHRTYLDTTGATPGKAPVTPNKAMLGRVTGGAVRLSRSGGALVVAEGIETGLSLLSDLLPGPVTVWAAMSASGMQALSLPERPGDLIVASDGDPPGRNAAEALAERAYASGWRVSMFPAPEGQDWNDVLCAQTGAA